MFLALAWKMILMNVHVQFSLARSHLPARKIIATTQESLRNKVESAILFSISFSICKSKRKGSKTFKAILWTSHLCCVKCEPSVRLVIGYVLLMTNIDMSVSTVHCHCCNYLHCQACRQLPICSVDSSKCPHMSAIKQWRRHSPVVPPPAADNNTQEWWQFWGHHVRCLAGRLWALCLCIFEIRWISLWLFPPWPLLLL